MAYRREALERVGGFDERFRRAYREDADLALRVMRSGYPLVVGERVAFHPVGAASPLVSVRLQRGNADDVLMTRLHGSCWRDQAGAPPGRLGKHRLVSGAAVIGLATGALGQRRMAAAAALVWMAGTAELARARMVDGPRSPGEVARMVTTSVMIPPAATYWWLRGIARWRRPPAWQAATKSRPAAVLFDRDGTLVRDVPYNGDPDAVAPMPGARQALDRIRQAGLPIGVVSNQSGVGRGRLRPEQVDAVNSRVEQLLGPIDVWLVCPHTESDRCECRKPAPGLVLSAAEALGVPPEQCAVVGDIGADVGAGRAAGARTILVPTAVTRAAEVSAAPEVAGDLLEAVNRLLAGLSER
jgi:HAD superfamily hydrolase (TIGR01662 family)